MYINQTVDSWHDDHLILCLHVAIYEGYNVKKPFKKVKTYLRSRKRWPCRAQCWAPCTCNCPKPTETLLGWTACSGWCCLVVWLRSSPKSVPDRRFCFLGRDKSEFRYEPIPRSSSKRIPGQKIIRTLLINIVGNNIFRKKTIYSNRSRRKESTSWKYFHEQIHFPRW